MLEYRLDGDGLPITDNRDHQDARPTIKRIAMTPDTARTTPSRNNRHGAYIPNHAGVEVVLQNSGELKTRRYPAVKYEAHVGVGKTRGPGVPITEARSPGGAVHTGASITEDDIVRTSSGEIQIKAAERVGLVSKNPDGTYTLHVGGEASPSSEGEGEGPEGTPDNAQDTTEVKMEALDETTESMITEAAQGADVGDVMSAINAFAQGEMIREDTVGRIASSLGLEPGEASDRIETVRAGFESQARAMVAKTGLDPQAVFDAAWKDAPELMQNAIRHHAMERNTGGYQAVVNHYVLNMDTLNPDAILNAEFPDGTKAHRGQTGKIMLATPKGRMEWKSAVRAGFVKIG